MVSGLDVSTERGGMNSDSVFVGDESAGADFDDRWAEFLDLFVGGTVDGLQLRKILRAGEDDASEGGGSEDEEEREVKFFGFGLPPFAEAGVEGLLLRGEVVGLLLRGALACEGFRDPRIYPRG